ncbi:MAG: hypothetical protein E4H01_01465 [Lysobacterales bacterium]|nr:MAG: hypothetical protein E4H01_01465 [Xanthomonadales bacterium]
MKLVPWPGHADDMRCINVQAMQIGQASETILALPWDNEFLRIYSRTLKLGEKPLAMLGVVVLQEGYGHGWALLSEEVLEYPKELTRHARLLIEKGRSIFSLTRMDITVDCRHHAAYRWGKCLGFEQVGTTRFETLNGEDAYLMTRTWNEL